MTELFVLIADEVGEYIPFTWTITCKQKYPVKLVIMNSPVFVLKLYGADAGGRAVAPVESYKEYEVKLQYVGLF